MIAVICRWALRLCGLLVGLFLGLYIAAALVYQAGDFDFDLFWNPAHVPLGAYLSINVPVILLCGLAGWKAADRIAVALIMGSRQARRPGP